MLVHKNCRLLMQTAIFIDDQNSVEVKEFVGPAHVVGNLAGLHAVEGVIQLLGER